MASEMVSSPINQADERLMEDMPRVVQKGERLSPAQSLVTDLPTSGCSGAPQQGGQNTIHLQAA